MDARITHEAKLPCHRRTADDAGRRPSRRREHRWAVGEEIDPSLVGDRRRSNRETLRILASDAAEIFRKAPYIADPKADVLAAADDTFGKGGMSLLMKTMLDRRVHGFAAAGGTRSDAVIRAQVRTMEIRLSGDRASRVCGTAAVKHVDADL